MKQKVTTIFTTLLVVICLVCGFFTYKYFALISKTDDSNLSASDVQIKYILNVIANDLSNNSESELSATSNATASILGATTFSPAFDLDENLYSAITAERANDFYDYNKPGSFASQFFAIYKLTVKYAMSQSPEKMKWGDELFYKIYKPDCELIGALPTKEDYGFTDEVIGKGRTEATNDKKIICNLYMSDFCVKLIIDFNTSNDSYTCEFYTNEVSSARNAYFMIERDGNISSDILFGKNFNRLSYLQTKGGGADDVNKDYIEAIMDWDFKNKKVFCNWGGSYNYNPDFTLTDSESNALFLKYFVNSGCYKLNETYTTLFENK